MNFSVYGKFSYVFNNIKNEKFKGIKVIRESDFLICLVDG